MCNIMSERFAAFPFWFYLNLTGDSVQMADCLSQAICLSPQQRIVFLKEHSRETSQFWKVWADSTLKEVIQKAAGDLHVNTAKYFSDESA